MSPASERVQNLLATIPGYRGYREKEDRRHADRRVREHVASAFARQAERVERVARQLAEQRRIQDVGPVDELARTIRHLIDRITTATYGYGGLFSDRNVDEVALDQLRRFDESLLQGAQELEAPIAALEQAAQSGGDLTQPARAGTAVVQAVLERLSARNEVIETGTSLPEERVLDLLKTKRDHRPPAPYALEIGDALSIGGDNYVVDARIEIEAGDHSIRMARLDAAAGRWLVVLADPDAMPFIAQSRAEPTVPGPGLVLDHVQFALTWSAAGTGELTVGDQASGRRAVRVAFYSGPPDSSTSAVVVDWGKEQQIFWGHRVHVDDIEIYGAARP